MAQQHVSFLLRHIRALTVVPTPEVVTDGQLLERYALGHEEDAFAILVERYGPLVLGLCRRLLRDVHDADDAFQATFLVLARKAGSIRKHNSVGSWLYGVAYRVSRDAKVKFARQRAHERRMSDLRDADAVRADETSACRVRGFLPAADPSVSAAARELRPMLEEELQRLPEKYQAPVILCCLQGKTNAEAARQLGWPTGTVKGRLSRARHLLRTRLTRRGVVLRAGGLALALAKDAQATPPSHLVAPVLHAAATIIQGPGTGSAVSASVAALASGVIRTMFWTRLKKGIPLVGLLIALTAGIGLAAYHSLAAEPKDAPAPLLPPLVRSAQSGAWSAPTTWEGGEVPGSGVRVQVRPGHAVVYDLKSEQPIRSIHVAGTLRFASDRDTRLDVGLIKIQPGDDASENGFDCDAHMKELRPGEPRPVLEVGTLSQPIPANHTALIRLVPVAGLDRESCPAIICCGGRMDFHGAPLDRTWVKLGATAKKGDTTITLAEPVAGWRVGDRIIVTASRFFRSSEKRVPRTGVGCAAEKTIRAIDETRLTIDSPLEEDHRVAGEFHTEVANLSRNVVIESGDPAGERGHTMYHRHSAGSISYAEFRHLGKPGVLGRYPIHYHLVGDTMRGSSVIGASVWDSGNRWVTIHGTNYLVVRDCVGYLSKGHGFYLEDGTEVYNVLDRNLAVQAYATRPLPKQALPFDKNDSAGFWWANCLNTFTRNVACGNERYGYRFEAVKTRTFDPTLSIQQPDGSKKPVDIRTLPFVRFEGNESHHNGTYGMNIGEGVDRVGPDHRHPLIIRNTKIWGEGYSFRPQSPSMLLENLRIGVAAYGIYHPNYDYHVYRNIHISDQSGETFNRGHDDFSVQYGPLTVDGLTFDNCGRCTTDTGMPMIQISDDNPTGAAISHFRNVKVVNYGKGTHRVLVNRGGGNRPDPKTEKGVPVYLHDWFGPGRHARIVSSRTRELTGDGLDYRKEFPLTGDESRVAEVKDVAFPQLLDPVDDLPPATVITHVRRSDGKVVVRGTTSDNGSVRRVVVNGQEARALGANFAEWEVILDGSRAATLKLEAFAEDAAGNREKRPHVVTVEVGR